MIGRINRGYHLSFFYSVISLSKMKSMRGLSLFRNNGLLLPLWFLLLPCRSGGKWWIALGAAICLLGTLTGIRFCLFFPAFCVLAVSSYRHRALNRTVSRDPETSSDTSCLPSVIDRNEREIPVYAYVFCNKKQVPLLIKRAVPAFWMFIFSPSANFVRAVV